MTEVTLTVMSPPLVELTEKRETGLKNTRIPKLKCWKTFAYQMLSIKVIKATKCCRVTSSIDVRFVSNQSILCNTYPVDPRVPLGAGDFRPGCSEAEVRTAVAVDLNVGGLAAGERAPGRGPAGTRRK